MNEELFEGVEPFSGDLPAPIQETGGGALVEAAVQREIAEVQAMMAIAKRFPRNQRQAIDRILVACQRPGLAEESLYSYARGGTNITGPSIRLAEAIIQQWGNADFGIKEVDQRNGESTVLAYAWDLETNTRQTKTFQVKHRRYTKKGTYNLEDPRDIYEMVANLGARRLRACILGIIPGDIVDAAQAQCEVTLKTKADISPEAIKKMLEKFGEYGVNKAMIEKRIQRNLEAITAAQVIGLRKIFNSLKDGMSKPEDWFELLEEPKQTATEKLAEKTRKPRSDKGQSRKHETSENMAWPLKNEPSEPPQDGQGKANEPVQGGSEAGNDPPILGGINVPARCKEVLNEIMALCGELNLNSEGLAGEYSADGIKNPKLLTLPEGEKLLGYLIDLKAKREEEGK